MKSRPLRVLLWVFSRACYRMTVFRPDNAPGQGGALLVSNHVSFVDMLLKLADTRRFVRFLPHLDTRDHWGVKLFVRYFGACHLSPESHLV